jgi:hypothetical protein
VSDRRLPTAVRPLSLVLTGALLAACSTGPGPSPTGAPPTGIPPTSEPTQAAVQLLLRVTSEGGFINPSANLASVPTVSVYADGRILSPGAVDAVYPGPLLPPVQVKDVGAAGAQAIVVAIRAAGLDKLGTGGGIGNPDAATTVFAVNVDGTTITTRFHLGGGPGGPGLPGAASPDPSVAAAGDLLNRLTDQTEAWGVPNPVISTLTPTAYRIFVAPGAPVGDLPTSQPAVAWPLATPLDQFGAAAAPDRGITGLRQGAVFGAEAATLGPVLAAANALTAFSSGGNLYTLFVRPLLPDEVPAPG